MECYCYLRDVQDFLADGKTPYERRFGESFKGPIIPFGALVEYLTNSERQSESSSIRKALFTGGIWKGDILTADIEELEKVHASEIYPRRLHAKEVLITHKDGEFVFPVADGSATLSGRDYEFQEPTRRRKFTERRERISAENLMAIGKSYNLKKQKMTKIYTRIFGLFKETLFIVIILNREFNYTC